MELILHRAGSIAIDAIQNQRVVGRVLTRHVGLKPDLRSNGLSGLKRKTVAHHNVFLPQGKVMLPRLMVMVAAVDRPRRRRIISWLQLAPHNDMRYAAA